MRWLNYQHLFYFWTVAKTGSVTAASQELRLAQPTISTQLKSLEDTLGEKLFRREGRRLVLTDTGSSVLRYAEKIFTLGNDLLADLDGHRTVTRPELRIGISDVVPKSIAYRLIEPALRPEADCLVTCLEDKPEPLLAGLALGEIDLVIADREIPPSVKVKAYNHSIGSSGVSFLGQRKLLKQLPKTLPEALRQAPLLLPTPEAAVRQELDQWFAHAGITPHICGTFQDRALMKIVAAAGHGILVIPQIVEAEVRREFNLAVLGRTNAVQERLYLISTEKRLKHPLIALLCQEGKRLFTGKTIV